MDFSEFAAIAAIARDITFIGLLLVGAVLAVLLQRKVSGFIVSARRVKEVVDVIVETFTEGFAKPPKRAGTLSGLGKGLSWLRRRHASGEGRKQG